MQDAINYWVELINNDIGLADANSVKDTFIKLSNEDLLQFFCIDFTGIFAYVIIPDLKGGKCLSELIFYIKPQFRGKLKLVKQYITRAEKIASENGCNSIKIGGNIGFKDNAFIELLKRWGYVNDTVSKEIR